VIAHNVDALSRAPSRDDERRFYNEPQNFHLPAAIIGGCANEGNTQKIIVRNFFSKKNNQR
jgi:hypothetical protein